MSITASDEDATNEENDKVAEDVAAILLALMLLRGSKVYTSGVMQAVANTLDVSLSREFTTALSAQDEKYIRDIVKSFNEDTAEAISKSIAEAKSAGLTTDEIKGILSDIKLKQSNRVGRFAKNESWRVSELAGLRAMMQLNDELVAANPKQSISLTHKTWNIQPGACPICIDYSGKSIKVSEKFYGGLDTPPAHVSCRCMLTYTLIKNEE